MGKIDLLNMEEDEVSYGLKGLKILIYGKNTLGKTPQAMKFPKPLLIMGESGGSALKGYKVSVSKKRDFVDTIAQLTDPRTIDKMQEKFQTIVIDTIEDIIEYYEVALAKEFGVRDVGEIQKLEKGNPNGYSVYRKEFKQHINMLTNCGYTVIFIAHEETIEVEDENGNTTTFIQPKGSKGDKSSSRFIRDLCDFRFYIKGNGIDRETNKTIMSTAWCVETKEFYAGSRYAIQSFVNPFTAENIIEAIEKAQKKSAEEQNSGLKEFKVITDNYTREDYLEAIKPYIVKLNKLYPDDVLDIVENQLGEGVKVSSATDEQLTGLDTIYMRLVSLACDRGIVVDTGV